ncbi:MAG TPA: OmpH family outer membrane protein [Pyrinomonadaceae bacterium]|jgi:Skp family chaperone for outer membrane proteins
MEKLRVFVKSFICVLVLSVTTFAQDRVVQLEDLGRMAIVESVLFYDENKGIGELVAVSKQVLEEYKPKFDELKDLKKRIKELLSEVETLSPREQEFKMEDYPLYQSKFNELQKSVAEFAEKNRDYKQAYQKRKAEAEYSLKKKIKRRLVDFAIKKGFSAIIDSDQIDSRGFTFVTHRVSYVTQDFIDYYNSLATESQ